MEVLLLRIVVMIRFQRGHKLLVRFEVVVRIRVLVVLLHVDPRGRLLERILGLELMASLEDSLLLVDRILASFEIVDVQDVILMELHLCPLRL